MVTWGGEASPLKGHILLLPDKSFEDQSSVAKHSNIHIYFYKAL